MGEFDSKFFLQSFGHQSGLTPIIDDLETHTLNKDCVLFYEGQRPMVGMLVLAGEIHLTRRQKKIGVLGEGQVVGVSELHKNHPIRFEAKAFSGTQVALITKSSLAKLGPMLPKDPFPLIFEHLKKKLLTYPKKRET